MACKTAARGYFEWVCGSDRLLLIERISGAPSEGKDGLTKGMWIGAKAGLRGDDKRRRPLPYDGSVNPGVLTREGM